MQKLVRMAATLVLLVLATGDAAAATLGVGSELPAITLADQHDAQAVIGPGVRIVVLTRDMAAGDVVKEAFAGMDQAALDLRGVVYVADISGMPSLVASMFAIPKMRDRSYRVVLDRDGAATRDLPYAEGRPTVLLVENGKIVRVAQPATGDQLRELLQPPSAP
jgi:hypothetical protein